MKFSKILKKRNFSIKLAIFGGIMLFIFLLLANGVRSAFAPDIQCTKSHNSSSLPPSNPKSAKEFFDLGNYHYDIGDCYSAISDYTRAIELDLNFAQAYDNRAYTNMRLRNYQDALLDLDKAIMLRPDYVNAIMNRGDIYNFYYNIDRKKAIKDYDKVLEIVKSPSERRKISICGHKVIAQNNGWGPEIYIKLITQGLENGCR